MSSEVKKRATQKPSSPPESDLPEKVPLEEATLDKPPQDVFKWLNSLPNGPPDTATSTARPEPEPEARDAGRQTLLAIADMALLALLGPLLVRSWRAQWAPIHGSTAVSATVPRSSSMYDRAVLIALGTPAIEGPDAGLHRLLTRGALPFAGAPWVFLTLALAQPFMFAMRDAFDAVDANCYEALGTWVVAALLGRKLLEVVAWYDRGRVLPLTVLRIAGFALASLLARACRVGAPQGDLLGRLLAPVIPYALLPEGWALPTLATAVAAGWAVFRFRGMGKQAMGAGYVPFAAFALLCALPVLHALFANTHSPLPVATMFLDAKLRDSSVSLIDRADGAATGYVSVLRQNEHGFTVMRCGHSLLGGVWDIAQGIVKEPVYAVFVMLEAVRLMRPTSDIALVPDTEAEALTIGLGIGTAPAAFIHHGIKTTIVELDQIVYDFAIEHFDLPRNHTAVIGDAIEWVHDSLKLDSTTSAKPGTALGAKQYDYILHDVFTGGVEPAELFTFEFLSGLKALLREHGSIAINYAGDFKLPTPRLVLRTILSVFGNCRIFRETDTEDENSDSDQTNCVVFCRKDGEDFTFRKAVESDFLGTNARKMWLQPTIELPTEGLLQGEPTKDNGRLDPLDQNAILYDSNVKALEELQLEAGTQHWLLMREVLPPDVWTNW